MDDVGVKRRTFTILDVMVLIAATGIALAWSRAITPSLVNTYAVGGFAQTFPLRLRYFTRPAPFLIALSLALLILRRMPPRPRRRLFRTPGMVACSAAAFGLAIVGETALMDLALLAFRGPPLQLSVFYLTMRVAFWGGMAVMVSWFTMALLGRWRRTRDRDWVERAGMALGFAWIVQFVAMQINI